jgi:hypothetical protein
MKYHARDSREKRFLILRIFTDNLIVRREGTEICMYGRQQENRLAFSTANRKILSCKNVNN